jgi:hypothetical protein
MFASVAYLAKKPGFGKVPFSFDCSGGAFENLRCLLYSEAAEIPEFYKSALLLIYSRQAFKSVIEGYKIHVLIFGEFRDIIQR